MNEDPDTSLDELETPIYVDFPTSGSMFSGFVLSNRFWFDRSGWPNDCPERVFLGNAVLRVGQAMFPEEWNDDDTQARKDDHADQNGARDRLLKVGRWIVHSALKGDFGTLTWNETTPFARQSETLWTRPDAFPKYFENCMVIPPDQTGSSVYIFFEGRSFAKALDNLIRAQTPKKYTASAEKQCGAWLRKKFEQDDPRRKGELRILALSEIRGLSGRAFDRSWDEVAEPFGRRHPGRPKSRQ